MGQPQPKKETITDSNRNWNWRFHRIADFIYLVFQMFILDELDKKIERDNMVFILTHRQQRQGKKGFFFFNID